MNTFIDNYNIRIFHISLWKHFKHFEVSIFLLSSYYFYYFTFRLLAFIWDHWDLVSMNILCDNLLVSLIILIPVIFITMTLLMLIVYRFQNKEKILCSDVSFDWSTYDPWTYEPEVQSQIQILYCTPQYLA